MQKSMGIKNLVILILSFWLPYTFAGIWHAGLEAQQINLTFKPTYSNTMDGQNDYFKGNASGQGLAAALDYETQLYKSLWISLQIGVSYDNAVWSSRANESFYNADIAWRYGVSLMPEYRLNKKYVLFTEFGIEEGLAKQDRDSELLGTFQNAQWLIGGAIGGGIRYEFNEKLGLFLSYRFTQFQNYEFYIQREDQSISQIVQDRPYSSITSLGFTLVIA